MHSPCKIELFARYHSETPRKVCPKQFAAYPDTVKPDPCGRILHSMSSRAYLSSRMQSSLLHSRTIETTGAACHGQPAPDFSQLSGRGVRNRFAAPLFVMQEKGFLRLSANFSAELHLITVIRNYQNKKNRAFASFLQTRGISHKFCKAVSA